MGHERREQHVALRVVAGVGSLRTSRALAIAHAAIAAVHTREFRIVHFNLLANHLHLILEAASAHARARGMQRLEVRLVRRLNRLLGRRGPLFDDRYYTRSLTTPTAVRNALAYVLLDGNRHELEHGAEQVWYGVDAYSSGYWFDGWADERWQHEVTHARRPTAEATTWLLRSGWRLAGGAIAFDTYYRSISAST
ncbi:MAG: hypothetical protein ACM31C_20550 [Acidobacteriota bacterium]